MRATWALMFFLMVWGSACSPRGEERAAQKNQLAERERRIAALQSERDALEQKARDMESALQAQRAAPPVMPAQDPCEERLRSLRATLNKAYLDIKIALVERDEYKNKLDALQSKGKERRKP